MKFADRLAHLPASVGQASKGAQLGDRGQPIEPSPVVDPLAEVRAKLERMTGLAAPPDQRSARVTGHEQDFAELPFVRVETEEGPIFRRIVTSRPSHQVGRYGLDSATAADTHLLSLLALDPSLSGCDIGRALFFDTETTGLGGAGTLAFLFGMSYRNEDGEWVLEQLILRHPSEECALLSRVAELVRRSALLVSFNGRSFDWPLMQARHVMNQIPKLEARPHLDLLHVSRRIHKKRLSRCRLVDLEAEVLGFTRGEDDIPGAEIAPRYGHFLRTGDEEALRAVIDHNAWDVWTMVALVGLYGQTWSTDHEGDLCSTAETLLRAKDLERAELFAERAMEAGAIHDGRLVRAKVRRARGDVALALLDFETLAREVPDPKVRLILAKLYEHHLRDLDKALEIAQLDLGEEEAAQARRIQRLQNKISKKKG